MNTIKSLHVLCFILFGFYASQNAFSQIKRTPITPDLTGQGVPQKPNTEVKNETPNTPVALPPIIIKQDDNPKEIIIKKPQKDNITIEGLLQLSFGNEPIMIKFPELKGRYFATEALAYRGTFAFEMGSNTQDIVDGRNTANVNTAVQNIKAGGGVELHLKAGKRISPYYGGEALILMSSTTVTGTNTDNLKTYTQNAGYVSDSTVTGIYLGALAGLDYYVNSDFYVGFEVGLGVTSYSGSKVGERTTLRGQMIQEKDVVNLRGNSINMRYVQGIRIGFKF
jgi:hypothetical protein